MIKLTLAELDFLIDKRISDKNLSKQEAENILKEYYELREEKLSTKRIGRINSTKSIS